MERPVLAAALIVAALAVIAVTMGIVTALPAGAAGQASCGHLFDAAYRRAVADPNCRRAVDDRRVAVSGAAGLAGAALVVGALAFDRVVVER